MDRMRTEGTFGTSRYSERADPPQGVLTNTAPRIERARWSRRLHRGGRRLVGALPPASYRRPRRSPHGNTVRSLRLHPRRSSTLRSEPAWEVYNSQRSFPIEKLPTCDGTVGGLLSLQM